MTLTALCERFLDKTSKISVVELKNDCTIENLLLVEPVWHIEYSKYALYSVKYFTISDVYMTVYVTAPNEGYKPGAF